ncbi:MADS-box protein AGL24-like isoform X1 [Bidens hawaiensis]|uniref:MADS-box protein AGL24-like isoform X1 n=1 Tax=Bidens hawaiensis TaxID=980011 RepID=UPI0040497DC7
MQGEDLQGLGLKDLNKLETIIESGLAAVVKTKGERMLKEISALKEKEAELLEENRLLKQQLIMGTCVEETRVQDHWSFHRSLELTISNPSSRDPSHNQNYSGSDTCLKLGLPFSN